MRILTFNRTQPRFIDMVVEGEKTPEISSQVFPTNSCSALWVI